jgi:hypothetical protein
MLGDFHPGPDGDDRHLHAFPGQGNLGQLLPQDLRALVAGRRRRTVQGSRRVQEQQAQAARFEVLRELQVEGAEFFAPAGTFPQGIIKVGIPRLPQAALLLHPTSSAPHPWRAFQSPTPIRLVKL